MSIRESISEEKEYFKLFDKLSDQQLQAIVQVGASFARAKNALAEAEKTKEATDEYVKQVEKYIQEDLPAITKETLETARKNREKDLDRVQQNIKDEELRTKQSMSAVDLQLKKELESLLNVERERLRAEKKIVAEQEQEMSKEIAELKRQYREESIKLDQKAKQREKVIVHSLEEKTRLAMQMAEFNREQKIRKHDRIKADMLQHDLAVAKRAEEGETSRYRVRMEGITDFVSGEEGKARLRNILGVVVGSIAVLYAFKVASPIVAESLKSYFFKPALVSRYSSHSWLSRLKSPFVRKTTAPTLVLADHLHQRMETVIQGTRTTSSRGGLFGHMLLYGSPGTGKTLFAEKLAKESGMDFAMMSGPSFDQYAAGDAIQEIRKLFKWANSSKNGLLLFIDECDSFLEDRATLSPERVRVLNEFINQTGTESRKFMLVFETNRPWVLDPAVQSRITRSIEFPPPTEQELAQLLALYIERHLVNPSAGRLRKTQAIDCTQLTDTLMKEMAGTMSKSGFVGRDVTNYVISLTQAAYSSEECKVTSELASTILEEQLEKKRMEQSKFKGFTF